MRHFRVVCFPECFPKVKTVGKQKAKNRSWVTTQSPNSRHSTKYGSGWGILMNTDASDVDN